MRNLSFARAVGVLITVVMLTVVFSSTFARSEHRPPDKAKYSLHEFSVVNVDVVCILVSTNLEPAGLSYGGVAKLVNPALHATADFDLYRKWQPFYYLVRKPRTKVSEITTRFLHLDPGLRNI